MLRDLPYLRSYRCRCEICLVDVLYRVADDKELCDQKDVLSPCVVLTWVPQETVVAHHACGHRLTPCLNCAGVLAANPCL